MHKICRIICTKYDKYARKYDKYAMCIYYGKYARKYVKYVKFADDVENMQNMHSPPCWSMQFEVSFQSLDVQLKPKTH